MKSGNLILEVDWSQVMKMVKTNNSREKSLNFGAWQLRQLRLE